MPLGAVFFAPQADSIEISATFEKSIAGCWKKDHGDPWCDVCPTSFFLGGRGKWTRGSRFFAWNILTWLGCVIGLFISIWSCSNHHWSFHSISKTWISSGCCTVKINAHRSHLLQEECFPYPYKLQTSTFTTTPFWKKHNLPSKLSAWEHKPSHFPFKKWLPHLFPGIFTSFSC